MLEGVSRPSPEAPRAIVAIRFATLQDENTPTPSRIVRNTHAEAETGASATQNQKIRVKCHA